MERKLTILMRALLAVALVAITLVLTYEFWRAGNGKSSLDVQEIRFAGVYQPEGGSGWAVWTPEISLDNARYPIVVLRGHFDKPIPENRKIYFYICHIGMELHQNGIKIGSLGTPLDLPPGTRTAGNGWFSLTSPGISTTDEITIILSCRSRSDMPGLYDYLLNEIHVGDAPQLFLKYFPTEGVLVMLGAVIVLLAAGLGAIWVILHLMKVPLKRAPLHLALFTLSQGLWMMLFSGIVTLLIPYPIELSLIHSIVFALNDLLLLRYLLDFLCGRSRLFLLAFICVGILLTVPGALLQATGVLDGFETVLFFSPPYLLGIIVAAVCLTVQMARCEIKRDWSFLAVVYILLFCRIVDVLNPFFPIDPDGFVYLTGIIIFICRQFAVSVNDVRKCFLQAAHAQEMEKQLLQSKISIMLSQIQPHFLYNSLTAIRQLCDIDPQKAKQAVTLFARYLRGNTESLTTAHCIPFEKELEHVKSYMALEQIRFEDELQVEYDIQAHGFLLPSLSLQPLVENAVRHGVSKKAGGGKVTIRTTETGDAFMVTVCDDGVGFDPDRIPQSRHMPVGIENVRNRLWSMCGGTLAVRGIPGAGVSAVITLPKEGAAS